MRPDLLKRPWAAKRRRTEADSQWAMPAMAFVMPPTSPTQVRVPTNAPLSHLHTHTHTTHTHDTRHTTHTQPQPQPHTHGPARPGCGPQMAASRWSLITRSKHSRMHCHAHKLALPHPPPQPFAPRHKRARLHSAPEARGAALLAELAELWYASSRLQAENETQGARWAPPTQAHLRAAPGPAMPAPVGSATEMTGGVHASVGATSRPSAGVSTDSEDAGSHLSTNSRLAAPGPPSRPAD